ncbi:hypothetical protein [Pseudomonas cerasi]
MQNWRDKNNGNSRTGKTVISRPWGDPNITAMGINLKFQQILYFRKNLNLSAHDDICN